MADYVVDDRFDLDKLHEEIVAMTDEEIEEYLRKYDKSK